jgi:hypothetical protein
MGVDLFPQATAVQLLAQQLLLVLGFGFLGANLRVGYDLLRYWRTRRWPLLVWKQPRPSFYRLSVLLGTVQALLLVALLLMKRPAPQIFGLAMMLIYFLALTPLSARIQLGFYENGVWADRGFVPWTRISGVSWRENPALTLLLLSPMRNIARQLHVPNGLYGEARKVLRERIRLHGFQVQNTGLDLGLHDDRDTA